MTDIDQRKAIARLLLDHDDERERRHALGSGEAPAAELMADLELGPKFPDGLAPVPAVMEPHPDANLPFAETCDILVITWTIDELEGLCDVLTPGVSRRQWHWYRHRFDDHYDPQIREGAPAKRNRRLGSWYRTQIGDKSVVCFKSELHLNQDGLPLNADGSPGAGKTGYATLPVKDLFHQLIEELQPDYVITTGTSGATYLSHDLGSVAMTRAAKFRLSDEFRNSEFNGKTYRSDWTVPQTHFGAATRMMADFSHNLAEPSLVGPTGRYALAAPVEASPANDPEIHLDGHHPTMPEWHPILTTDFFEFGTSDNGLEDEGCAVEMGDAVLGMVCEELDKPPKWLVARNISDPQINAELPIWRASGVRGTRYNLQTMWAVWYYETYGYWTSVNGALACWAVIAGLQD